MKQIVVKSIVSFPDVAPFTGAWIETLGLKEALSVEVVAPFTGAWIETVLRSLVLQALEPLKRQVILMIGRIKVGAT